MLENKRISRRTFIKTSVLLGGAAALAACGAPAAAPTTAPTSAPAAPAATTAPAAPAAKIDLPFPVDATSMDPFKLDLTVPVDGQFFSGGFGDDYIRYAAKIEEMVHPGLKVNVTALQKVQETLQPRFVGGNPPDVIDNSGAGMFKTVDLVNDGQLLDLSALFEAPALDTPGKKFKDTLFPGSQSAGAVFNGKQYGVNVAYTVSGIWWSKTLADKNGWKYPETWDDMLAFCEQIKKDGKYAPWTYQGKYPYYMWGIVWQQLLYKAGGNDVVLKIDNLEPNAWKDPAVLRATEQMFALWDKGYIMPGTAGLTHTESQAEWLKNKAVFIPCGTWLENEMKTVTPKDFNMVMGGIPGFKDGKGDQKAIMANGGETFVVPSKGKNTKGGMEYLRAILSKSSAKWFAENVSSMMPVVGATEGAKISDGMKSALAVVGTAGTAIIDVEVANYYSKINKELEVRTGELLTGKTKPADFLTTMQKLADDVAKDPDTPKQKHVL
ncbi:MAG TPA: N-acetylglucosamine/diacetylchitobiose ABC transporter substrate-binding protein [Anaerolineae bacterium]|jgi:N-acetylglucosamine transport system substrate-binding protein